MMDFSKLCGVNHGETKFVVFVVNAIYFGHTSNPSVEKNPAITNVQLCTIFGFFRVDSCPSTGDLQPLSMQHIPQLFGDDSPVQHSRIDPIQVSVLIVSCANPSQRDENSSSHSTKH